MDKEDLALNNLKWLIGHKTQSNPTNPNHLSEKKSLYHCMFYITLTDWFYGHISSYEIILYLEVG